MNPVHFYKCLADETRLRVLLLIHQEQELCVCELTEALGESQPKVSRHLAQLRQSHLLADRKEGKWVYYRLDPTLPPWAKTVLSESATHNLEFIKENRKALLHMPNRPSRGGTCCD